MNRFYNAGSSKWARIIAQVHTLLQVLCVYARYVASEESQGQGLTDIEETNPATQVPTKHLKKMSTVAKVK